MNTVDKMRQKRKSPSVFFMKFTRIHEKNNDALYCFCEGDFDDKYYGIRLEQNTDFQPVFISCEGKRNVIGIRQLFEKNKSYSKVRKAYFVDHDFDDSISGIYDDIYETPCYAIENFYTSESVLKKIIRSEFKIYEDDDNFSIIVNTYKNLQGNFHSVVLDLNSWIYYQRKMEKINSEKREINITELKYNDLYRIKLDSIQKKYDINYLNEVLNNSYEINYEIFNGIKDELSTKNKQQVFRGKYEFNFLCSFLSIISAEYNKCKKGVENCFKKTVGMKTITLNISNSEDMLARLSIHAETPPCLTKYLDSLLLKYKEVS